MGEGRNVNFFILFDLIVWLFVGEKGPSSLRAPMRLAFLYDLWLIQNNINIIIIIIFYNTFGVARNQS